MPSRVDSAHSATPLDVEPVHKVLGGLLIAAADQQKAAFAECVAVAGVTPVQARALLALDQPTPMRGWASLLGCDASQATGLADQREELGLVERAPGRDRRVKHLTTTARGVRVRRRLLEAIDAAPFPTARLSGAEQRQFERLLTKVLGGAERHHQH